VVKKLLENKLEQYKENMKELQKEQENYQLKELKKQ